LLPTSSSSQNKLTEGIPAKDTKTDLASGEIPSFLKQIKKVNHEFAIIFEFWKGEVGAFPDLGGGEDFRRAARSAAASDLGGFLFQAVMVEGRKVGFKSQAFSNRKQGGRGMFVEAETRSGKWSEVGR
jgi:hypothetical protein